MMRQMREEAVKSGIELPNSFEGIFDESKVSFFFNKLKGI